MTIILFSQIVIVCLLGAMSPGPSMVVVLNNAIFKNKFNGILTALGHGVGIGIYAICAVIGIGLILKTNLFLFNLLKIFSIIFLLYLGVKAIYIKGSLDFSQSVFDKFFNFEIPLNVGGLENEFLVPHHSWDNLEKYFSTGNMLTRLFNNNFENFKIQDSDILAAGPKTDLSA